MTTQPHLDPPTNAPTTPKATYQAPLLEGILEAGVSEKDKNEIWGIVGPKNGIPENSDLSDPFAYTLAALPHLEQRLKWGKVTTLEGQPIADLWAFLRAVETGQL